MRLSSELASLGTTPGLQEKQVEWSSGFLVPIVTDFRQGYQGSKDMSSIDGRYTSPSHADFTPRSEASTAKIRLTPQEIRERCEVPRRIQEAIDRDATVDEGRVEFSVRIAEADMPVNQSSLAAVLRNPDASRADRDQIIRQVASSGPRAFFANETNRAYIGSSRQALREDQRDIANAVQSAFESGAINVDDLQRIADYRHPQSFMFTLRQGASSNETGSAAQALADRMWTRNGADGEDRAVAVMYYASNASVMARNLNSPAKRLTAFEAIVDFNHSEPYKHLPPNAMVNNWRNDATSAAGRLFISHGQELVDLLSSTRHGHGAKMEPVAKFMSQTLFNPDAKGILLDRQRDLIPTVQATLSNVISTYLDRATAAPTKSAEQIGALEQLGRLNISIDVGSSLALASYSEKVADRDAAGKEIGGLVGSVISTISGKLDTVFGSPAEWLATSATEQIMKNARPLARPDAFYSGDLYDELTVRIAVQQTKLNNFEMQLYFNAVQAGEGPALAKRLNINPGGHAN
jgi:hypothetical protein